MSRFNKHLLRIVELDKERHSNANKMYTGMIKTGNMITTKLLSAIKLIKHNLFHCVHDSFLNVAVKLFHFMKKK
jgi:hypothetical protein